jgi:hypothetical protein
VGCGGFRGGIKFSHPMGKVVLILLVVLNLFLAANLVWSGSAVPAVEGSESTQVQQAEVAVAVQAKESAPVAVPKTEFASVYASDPKQFAVNLRRAGCPEETVRDILVAEIGRRYHSREEDLRPKPGDHLPWGWSAKTHEAKIIERRQAAAGMAREKEMLLRAALGYEVKVPIPTYAMTVSDQVFEERLKTLPPEKRTGASGERTVLADGGAVAREDAGILAERGHRGTGKVEGGTAGSD